MRHSVRHLATSVAFASVVVACSDDPASIGFMEPPAAIVTAASVVTGENVPIRLENRSVVTWSYNMCANALLQRQEGDQWKTLPPRLALCAPESTELPPGGVVDEELYVPLGAEGGTYRALLVFELDGNDVERTTNHFEVVGEIGAPSGALSAR